jgi:hypothetical protein
MLSEASDDHLSPFAHGDVNALPDEGWRERNSDRSRYCDKARFNCAFVIVERPFTPLRRASS